MKKLFVLTLGVAALACACTREAAPAPQNDSREVRFSLEDTYCFTKATEAKLEDGDAIQIIAGAPINANTSATVAGTGLNLSSKLFWAAGQKTSTEFVAIYPGAGQTSTTIDNYDLVANGKHEYAYHSKYLVASTTAAPGTTVALAFKHPFSKVVVNITNELGADKVTGVTFSGVVLQGAMDLAKGTIDITGKEAGSVNAAQLAENQFAAIIMPQTARPALVVRTELGSTFNFALPADFTFEAGKVATAAITLKGGGSGEGGREEVAFSFDVTDWAAVEANPAFEAGESTMGDYWQIFGNVYADEDVKDGKPTVGAWEKKYNMTYMGEGKWTITINYDPAMSEANKGFLFVKGETYAGMYKDTENLDAFATGYELKTDAGERVDILLTEKGKYTFTLDVEHNYNLTFSK